MLQCPVPWMKCSVPVQARQRALGNIQFIGFLYKKKMLTEKIMHSCIVRLMNDVLASPGAAVLLSLLAIHVVLFGCNKQTGVPNVLKWVPLHHLCSNGYMTCLCTPTTQSANQSSNPSLALFSKHHALVSWAGGVGAAGCSCRSTDHPYPQSD